MALTVRQIEAAKPSSAAYTVRDDGGLFLFIAASGVKSWHFRYSLGKKQRRISFGTYPEITLQRARELTLAARTQVANGLDPAEHRPTDKRRTSADQGDSFRTAAERWLKGKQDSGRASSTVDKMRTYLDKDMLPELGDKHLKDITRADCTRLQERIEKRGALNVAKKTRGWLREIFSQAIARGLCEYNPASELRFIAKEPPKSKPYPHLLEPELPAFLTALHLSKSRFIAKAAAQMALLTASRPGMVRFAEWSEIDLKNALWTVSAQKMKMRRKHVTPLPSQLVDTLEQLHRLTGRQHLLFPGIGTKNETISENTINGVFARIGYKGRMVGHGTRHTASTLLREHGWNKDHVETQLAHVEQGTAGDYNHAAYLPQRRAMMQWYADYLDSLHIGITPTRATKFAKRVNVYVRPNR
ncbi:tyrosine-type recombinase/integrase [Ralstonia pseudosolanacearum]|uniref:tyrosine-type recombinase/integrase n=1 Tax=Ralstonia pseudosolanacearum TaxID=1310165 RepID=UPI004053A8C2